MVNCFYDCYVILNKVYSEGAYLKQAINSTFIEEKNRSLTVKTCYGVLDRDIELSYYIEKLTQKNPKLVIRTVLKIAFYHIKYLNKHPYAVTDNAVTLVKKLGKGGTAGFVNAVLRKFATTDIQLPDSNIKRLSIEYSYPEFAVKKLIDEYGLDKAKNIMGTVGGDGTLVFKNTDGEKYLQNLGVNFEPAPYKNVFRVKNFVRNADYDKGVYTFQSIGSVAICESVGTGESLFDACSAPGGKSVYLADRFKLVTAEELHPHRAELIKEYASRMDVKNIKVIVGDACVFNPDYENAFDAVLCDSPCSGFGVAFENPDIKLNKEEKNIKELCFLQGKILENCSKYVKNGGKLIYSTCSFFKEENDGAVSGFLSKNGNFKLVENEPKLTHIKTEYGCQFLPDISGGGFYVSVMEKNS